MLKFLLSYFLLFVPLSVLADTTEQTGVRVADLDVQLLIDELGLRESAIASRNLPGWSSPKKIVVRQGRPGALKEYQALAPGVDFVMVESLEQARTQAVDAQAVLGYCDEEMLSGSPGLFWVQVYSAGVERCVANPSMHNGNRLLTNGQRIGSPALAEHSIAMMLMLARGLDVYYANQLSGKWKRETQLDRTDHVELEGRTLLVVGLGGIGTQVAKRGHGLGMRVIATRNSRREGPEYVEYVGLSHELNELAARADVVINTAPLTDQTRGIFNTAFFDAMKPGAFFISVGRGGSTVTGDLVSALRSGSIGGAGLDVTDPEPLPEGHPLWTMPRVIITPHTAGRSDKGRDRLYLMVKENLRRYLAGEPMLSVVDIERGY
ncbi:MAG: D-2-hydroxyacid dehydrogenase [Xanthomonadales bacterium]|nr:D-2-hydroxyacid dehydrogenase [Xanthomonadales bacterium]